MTEVKRAFVVFLTFSGQCRQALEHYQQCFGGELVLQTLGDATGCWKMDKRIRDVIVCATLTNDYFKLAASDLPDDAGVVIGNNISIMIECTSHNERDRLTDLLSDSKTVRKKNSNKMVSVVDKYHINWLLSVE
jgi:PhnB protein